MTRERKGRVHLHLFFFLGNYMCRLAQELSFWAGSFDIPRVLFHPGGASTPRAPVQLLGAAITCFYFYFLLFCFIKL
ncbi:hypothetical protein F4774DRAFT_402623 [Daldinia eschscholtzii]|nr:hypothetical protein F4774DRAFT_402623 [Daldinia eschscholtzii]